MQNPGSAPPDIEWRWKTRQITAKPLANDNHRRHLQLLLAVHLILIPSKGPAELRQRDLFPSRSGSSGSGGALGHDPDVYPTLAFEPGRLRSEGWVGVGVG